MCTLSIIPYLATEAQYSPERPAGVRIACNRDESRFRPTALPPEQRTFERRQALLPIDPASGGTWVAASDAGLFATLMNVYTRPVVSIEMLIASRAAAKASRGTIIPAVLRADDLAAARQLALALEPTDFEPFRLILADRRQWSEVVWADEHFAASPVLPIERPLFFTSSGLGDEVVANPRRQLFDRLLAPGGDWPAAQDAFHRDVQPGREFASVWMTRAEARTVSLTVVEITPRDVVMRYVARGADDAPLPRSDEFTLSLSADAAGAGK